MGFLKNTLNSLRKLITARSRAKSNVRAFKFRGESPKVESDWGADQETYKKIYRNEPFVRSTVGAAVDACIKSGWNWLPRFPELEVQQLQGQIKTVRNWYEHPTVEFPGFLRNLITNLLILDDVYIECAEDNGAKGIYVLDSAEMKVKRDVRGRVTGYVFREGQGDFETPFKPEEIVHIAMNKMGSAFYGVSDLETIVRSANLYSQAKGYNERLFDNSGIPTLAITVKGASKDQMDRIEEYLKTVEAGDNLLLDGDIEIKPISGFNKDLEYVGLLNATRQEMMVVMRVPTVAIALDVSTNLETARGALTTFGFRINGIQQIVENAIDRITIRLFGDYYKNVRFELNEWVDPYQQAQIDAIYLKWGVFTPNDVRERLKMKPRPWGNKPYTPATTIPGQPPRKETSEDGQGPDTNIEEQRAERQDREKDTPGVPNKELILSEIHAIPPESRE